LHGQLAHQHDRLRSSYSPKAIHLLTGEYGEILGRLEVACRSTKAAISLKRVKIVLYKKLWTAYRNSPTLFRTVPSPTPYTAPLSRDWGSQPPLKTAIAIISGTGKATNFKFGT